MPIDRGVIDFQEPKLLRGPEVPGDVLEDLRGFALEEGETLVWFSGLRAFGYNVMGCALTDRRVFAYEFEPGQKDSRFQAAALGDLDSVVARFGGVGLLRDARPGARRARRRRGDRGRTHAAVRGRT